MALGCSPAHPDQQRARLAEVTFSVYGERGSVDVLAWHRASGSVLVVEVKSRLVDLQDTLAALDRKVRLAPQLASERGWGVGSVSAWVVVRDTRTNRRVLAAHRLTLRSVLPTDGRKLAGWLRRPVGTVRALSFLPDSHPRNR